jgi:hypothetical protein
MTSVKSALVAIIVMGGSQWARGDSLHELLGKGFQVTWEGYAAVTTCVHGQDSYELGPTSSFAKLRNQVVMHCWCVGTKLAAQCRQVEACVVIAQRRVTIRGDGHFIVDEFAGSSNLPYEHNRNPRDGFARVGWPHRSPLTRVWLSHTLTGKAQMPLSESPRPRRGHDHREARPQDQARREEPVDGQDPEDGSARSDPRGGTQRRSHLRRSVPARVPAHPLAHRRGTGRLCDGSNAIDDAVLQFAAPILIAERFEVFPHHRV